MIRFPKSRRHRDLEAAHADLQARHDRALSDLEALDAAHETLKSRFNMLDDAHIDLKQRHKELAAEYLSGPDVVAKVKQGKRGKWWWSFRHNRRTVGTFGAAFNTRHEAVEDVRALHGLTIEGIV